MNQRPPSSQMPARPRPPAPQQQQQQQQQYQQQQQQAGVRPGPQFQQQQQQRPPMSNSPRPLGGGFAPSGMRPQQQPPMPAGQYQQFVRPGLSGTPPPRPMSPRPAHVGTPPPRPMSPRPPLYHQQHNAPAVNARPPATYPIAPSTLPQQYPAEPTANHHQHGSNIGSAASKRRAYPEFAQTAYEHGTADSYSHYAPAAPHVQSQPNEFFVPGERAPLMTSHQDQASEFKMAPTPTVPQTAPGLVSSMAGMSLGSTSVGQQSVPQVVTIQAPPPLDAIDELPPSIILPQGSTANGAQITCAPEHLRCTMTVLPDSDKLYKRTRIPLGVVMTPFRTATVPVIEEVTRCSKCRMYINPYIKYVDGGRRWLCPSCGLHNDIPRDFDFDQIRKQPVDRFTRPEVTNATVEFMAPAEYMTRPPMPPVYLFIIDVSYPAVQCGMLESVSRSILSSLDGLSNEDERTKVGFICVDTNLYYFNLGYNLNEPQMLIVPELDDVFLPIPSDLLVNLCESKSVIESLLHRLPGMFRNNHCVGNALGSALQSAKTLLGATGGKIVVLQASLPDKGAGALRLRDHSKSLGTATESGLLHSSSDFYKDYAPSCFKLQVSVDVFSFGSNTADLATLSNLSRFTGGRIFHYPELAPDKPSIAECFEREFRRHLTRGHGNEAVLRVRASTGLSISAYYGHFFLRSMDLLALPSVNPDQCYAADLEYTGTGLTNQSVAYVQAALLYTTFSGERRIRVSTLAVPVSPSISRVFHGVDQQALASLVAKKAVDRALTSRLEDAREAVLFKCAEILAAFKAELTGAKSGASTHLQAPHCLQLLPLFTLSLLKHTALIGGGSILPDVRIAAMTQLTTLPAEIIIQSQLVPHFYALHTLAPPNIDISSIDEDDPETFDALSISASPLSGLQLPPRLHPTAEVLAQQPNGAFLLHSGNSIFLWFGRDVHPQLVQDLLGLPSVNAIPMGGPGALLSKLPVINTQISRHVRAIIREISVVRNLGLFEPVIRLVRETSTADLRSAIMTYMVEDKVQQAGLHAYHHFISDLHNKVNSTSL